MSAERAAPVASASAPHVFRSGKHRYLIRSAQVSDEEGLRRMLESVPAADIRLRFFRHVRLFSHDMLEPLTRVDEKRYLAYVVEDQDAGPLVASAMLVADRAGDEAEFGILVAREHAGQRLGSHLMGCLVRQARAHGFRRITGLILAENSEMIDLARRSGFSIGSSEEPGCVRAERVIEGGDAAAA